MELSSEGAVITEASSGIIRTGQIISNYGNRLYVVVNASLMRLNRPLSKGGGEC